MVISFLLFIPYLIGAVPTSYLLVRLLTGHDIRLLGSGNSGATNAARILGLPYFFIVLLLDACKSYAAMWCAAVYGGWESFYLFIVAGMVLLGNAYSPFLQFRGGKGVATSVGLMLFLYPWWVFTVYLCLFVMAFERTRRIDMSSLFSSVAGALVLFLGGQPLHLVLAAACLAVWIWYRHASNIVVFLHSRR